MFFILLLMVIGRLSLAGERGPLDIPEWSDGYDPSDVLAQTCGVIDIGLFEEDPFWIGDLRA